MELKTMESDVSSLCNEYITLRKSLEDKKIKFNDTLLALPQLEGVDSNDDTPGNIEKQYDYESLHSSLIDWKDKVLGLQEKADKFRKRLQEKDPITGASRYGEKTATRVKTLLSNFDKLLELIQSSFTNNNTNILQSLESILQTQQSIQTQQQKELQLKLQKQLEQEKQMQLQKEREEEERRKADVLAKKEREAELAQRAEVLRRARAEELQRVREEQRMFMDSIPKGEDGIKLQFNKLKTSCTNADYKLAIKSLHTVYSQILSHPEEVKYRKIRRDHPKFHQDIGRHDGGVELFIASGFTLEEMEDVACLFSKEPDLEHDMEGWTNWFDLLKLTLELIEKEL